MINDDDDVSDVTNDDLHDLHLHLIREQNSDPDISCLFARSVGDRDVSCEPVCFYTENNVLMRKWRPSDVLADDGRAVKHQVSDEVSDALLNTNASSKIGVQPRIMLSDILIFSLIIGNSGTITLINLSILNLFKFSETIY